MSKNQTGTPRISRSFGRRLRALLERRGITQVELADRVGVTKASVGDWIHARSLPSTSNLTQISAVTGESVSTLLGERPDSQRPAQSSLERLERRLGGEKLKILAGIDPALLDELLGRALLDNALRGRKPNGG